MDTIYKKVGFMKCIVHFKLMKSCLLLGRELLRAKSAGNNTWIRTGNCWKQIHWYRFKGSNGGR
eukprot:12420848-Karenia_brevis.AAC.1